MSALKRGHDFKLMTCNLENWLIRPKYLWVEEMWLKIYWLLLICRSFQRQGFIMQDLKPWQIPW